VVGVPDLLGAWHMCDIAVVVLTHNEELNLPFALESVAGWAREIFVLDSFSSDATLEVARRFGAFVYENKFEDYSKQRNVALTDIAIGSEWVLFLDADEWVTQELKNEIARVIASNPLENGFFLKYRMIWMGTWVRRGYYPTWILRMFRRGRAHFGDRSCNEHLVIDGATGFLKEDFIHEDRKSISDWIAKHNRYATLEAFELLKEESTFHDVRARLWRASQVERKRWLRYRVWNRLPPLLRPLIYFVYRSVFCGGFLDGPRALVYHFLQALWYPLLIDIKYLELRAAEHAVPPGPSTLRQDVGMGK
jgi:glycosyltransferase involved in cell wall biosynthesis